MIDGKVKYEQLKERIKEHEGFVPRIYKDSLGFATIGYGHLVKEGEQWEEGKEYTKEQLEYVFDTDFEEAKKNAFSLIGDIELVDDAKCVIIEMVFQLGIAGVGKFKAMWKALKENDYNTASLEMLDSRWAKQTPKRAEKLSAIMNSCKS